MLAFNCLKKLKLELRA
uniref:Katanin p60 ATPase-containing subunit A1 n=1 Tax=Rhizophora mucronata TaxID=61149 RepID=A0A2P2J1B2_RHIMU